MSGVTIVNFCPGAFWWNINYTTALTARYRNYIATQLESRPRVRLYAKSASIRRV